MMLAPCVRFQLSKEQIMQLEEDLKGEKSLSQLYLKQLKNGSHKPKSMKSTWPAEDKDDDDDLIVVGKRRIFSAISSFLKL